MLIRKSLQQAFDALPDAPGIYIFKGSDDSVLYIGKAKSLKKRVSQYQNPSSDKIAQMVLLAFSLQIITTQSELDALLLEAQMIQNHQPPFNVVYRGGRPFLYLIITKIKVFKSKDGIPGNNRTVLPELILTRDPHVPGVVVGRFLQKNLARQIHIALLKVFALRLCKKKIAGGCVYWHIGQCAGSCREDFDKADYLLRINALGEVLTSGMEKYVLSVEEQIEEACRALAFEKARSLTRHLDLLNQCREVLGKAQEADIGMLACPLDQKDVWILWPENLGLLLFTVVQSRVQRRALWLFIDQAQEYITNYYACNPIPLSIFTNFDVDGKGLLEKFLTIHRAKREALMNKEGGTPQLGKSGLSVVFDKIENTNSDNIGLAALMAQSYYRKFSEIPDQLSKLVGSSVPVKTIDCFDVSHKQGHFIVAACVRFVNGREDRSGLRHFKITGLSGSDDYASLAQAVKRRYRDGGWPDLILIDGGKGQISSVLPNIGSVPVAGLAKREERLFCHKNSTIGVKLELKDPCGALLIEIRDTAHRRALRFHTKLFEANSVS